MREAIFAKLLPREQTHVGADVGIGVLIKIDKAIDIRGNEISISHRWFSKFAFPIFSN